MTEAKGKETSSLVPDPKPQTCTKNDLIHQFSYLLHFPTYLKTYVHDKINLDIHLINLDLQYLESRIYHLP